MAILAGYKGHEHGIERSVPGTQFHINRLSDKICASQSAIHHVPAWLGVRGTGTSTRRQKRKSVIPSGSQEASQHTHIMSALYMKIVQLDE